MLKLEKIKETFDLHTSFSISRGVSNVIDVVTVSLSDGEYTGRGECRPYARYNETPDSVLSAIEVVSAHIENGASRLELLKLLPAGAARNAVDCALWDLESKQAGKSVWNLIGSEGSVKPVPTVQTLSLLSPKDMAKAAKQHSAHKTLKIKLGGDSQDIDRLRAIKVARPDAELVIDANEGWTFDELKEFVDYAQDLNVSMIEQPLPKGSDGELRGYDSGSILICGDESIHDIHDIVEKSDLYGMVNIKLDKAGGLTHALQMVDKINELNNQGKKIQLMVGCMVCTSLAIAPHIILAQNCDLADLDGPWWLSYDREDCATFKNGTAIPGTLWGLS